MADISAFINADVASEINAGNQSSSDLGVAIANAIKAKMEYNNKTETGVDLNAVAVAKNEAYTNLQSSLAAAASTEARAQVLTSFGDNYVKIYSEADADITTQAKLHQTSAVLLIETSKRINGNAKIGLRKQAELIRGKATALAIESIFTAKGASDSTLEALIEARTRLISKIRTATSVEAILQARSEYKATLDAHTEATFEINAETRTTIESEIETRLSVLVNTITSLSVFTNGIAEITAEAFANFYANAETNAKASFVSSGVLESDAEAAAKVLVLVKIMA